MTKPSADQVFNDICLARGLFNKDEAPADVSARSVLTLWTWPVCAGCGRPAGFLVTERDGATWNYCGVCVVG